MLVTAASLITSLGYSSVSADEINGDQEVSFPQTAAQSYITGYISDSGTLEFKEASGVDRAATETIAVFIGGQIVGYLTASVIDGIVISAIGQSSADRVADAIAAVVNKPYQESIELEPGPFTCPGVVIDHSGGLCA